MLWRRLPGMPVYEKNLGMFYKHGNHVRTCESLTWEPRSYMWIAGNMLPTFFFTKFYFIDSYACMWHPLADWISVWNVRYSFSSGVTRNWNCPLWKNSWSWQWCLWVFFNLTEDVGSRESSLASCDRPPSRIGRLRSLRHNNMVRVHSSATFNNGGQGTEPCYASSPKIVSSVFTDKTSPCLQFVEFMVKQESSPHWVINCFIACFSTQLSTWVGNLYFSCPRLCPGFLTFLLCFSLPFHFIILCHCVWRK